MVLQEIMVCIMASHPAKMQVTCTATIYRWLSLLLHHVPLASLTIWFPHVDTIMVGHLFWCNRTNIYQGCYFSLSQGKPSNQGRCNLAMEIKMYILLLWVSSHWTFFPQNECIHNLGKKPHHIYPCLLCEMANNVFSA